MLIQSHMVFAVFGILLFISHVSNKFVFVIMVLLATMIPDLDTHNSSYGRHLIFRPLQFFVRHRGIIHSFTTAAIVSCLIALKWPVASFGFFVGYSIHLFCDSFTKDGIQPFWPLKWKSSGPLITGGRFEEMLFLAMIFINLFIFFIVVI